MANYFVTDALSLGTTTDNGTSLTYTQASRLTTGTIVRDVNDDDNLDIGVDYYDNTGFVFSGYYFVAPNGENYGLYRNTSTGDTWVPYSDAHYDLDAVFPNTGVITTKTDNLVGFLCFAAGTRIATPAGERLVEDMQIGDRVRTADGRITSVRWVGRQTRRRFAGDVSAQLVCIHKNALGPGVPWADLTVTGDHGMVIDGVVINAAALVNGTTIDWVPVTQREDEVTVYHLETTDHDIILANNAPTETFIDAASRSAFDNHQEYLDLYGVERIIPEMRLPRITSSRLLPAALQDQLGMKTALTA